MEPMEQFKAAKAEMKTAMEKANNVVKDAFRNAAKSLFQENSDLVSFSWAQYTPYFNDGDPCNFYAHADYPDVNGICVDDIPEEKMALADKVVAFLEVFDDDDFETMFGDHCKVTVTSTEIEIDGYDHD